MRVTLEIPANRAESYPQMALTDAQIKQAKPSDKAQKLIDGQGLYLEVTPSGAKRWRIR